MKISKPCIFWKFSKPTISPKFDNFQNHAFFQNLKIFKTMYISIYLWKFENFSKVWKHLNHFFQNLKISKTILPFEKPKFPKPSIFFDIFQNHVFFLKISKISKHIFPRISLEIWKFFQSVKTSKHLNYFFQNLKNFKTMYL